jgi:hypothetical protein
VVALVSPLGDGRGGPDANKQAFMFLTIQWLSKNLCSLPKWVLPYLNHIDSQNQHFNKKH